MSACPTLPRVSVARQIHTLLERIRARDDKEATGAERVELCRLARQLYRPGAKYRLEPVDLIRLAKIVHGDSWRTPPCPEESIPADMPPGDRVYVYMERLSKEQRLFHPDDEPWAVPDTEALSAHRISGRR